MAISLRTKTFVHRNAFSLQFPGGAGFSPFTENSRMDFVQNHPWTDIAGERQGPGVVFQRSPGNHNFFHVSIPSPDAIPVRSTTRIYPGDVPPSPPHFYFSQRKGKINMKIRLLLFSLFGICTVTVSVLAQVPLSQRNVTAPVEAQAAINAATNTIKGKAFPKRFEAATAKVQGFCEPYETRQQQKVAELSNELPKGTNKNHSETFSSTYSPTLPVWVISSYQRIEANKIASVSVTVDAVPGGFHLLTSSQFQSEYNSIKNYVLNLNIADKVKADLTAKVEDYVKNYSSYSMEISASHGTVIHKAVLSGAGLFNGRTAYNGWINTVEVCAPPEATDLAALDLRLKSWVNGVAKSLTTGGAVRFDPNSVAK